MAPPVAAALAFVLIFNPEYGPVNQILRGIGFNDPPLWFYGPNSSKWGLVLLGLWGVGDAMIIFLAGLLDVPRQLYEAAEIEGANGRQKFRFVTLPMLSPVIFFSTVIGVIYGFQLFTQAYVASLAASGSTVTDAAANLGDPQGSMLFYCHLPVPTGVPGLPDGIRVGDGLGVVRDHDGLHGDDHQGVAPLGALPGRWASDDRDERRRSTDQAPTGRHGVLRGWAVEQRPFHRRSVGIGS